MRRRHFIATMGAGIGSLLFPLPTFATFSENTLPFQDGDIVSFIGDSITHNGNWHLFVSTYFMTRFPGRKIRYINSGITGDTTFSVLKRWKTDIAPTKPSLGIVMLGMNDVGVSLYTTSKPSSDNLERRKSSARNYQRNLAEIVRRLKELSCREIMLVSPSLFDQTANISKRNCPGANDALAEFGKKIQELALQQNVRYIDIHGPMTQLSEKLQQNDPAFSFTPHDRIHPGELGHLVMAYFFLKSLQVPDLVSEISIDADSEKTEKQAHATVSNLKCSGTEISFDLLEEALPYPVPAELSQIEKIVPVNNEFNRQLLQVRSLKSGLWTLKIDNKEIGKYLASDLQKGINLAECTQTPQYKQASEVLRLNRDRSTQERQYRDFMQTRIQLENKGIPLDDEAKTKQFFHEYAQKSGTSNAAYYNRLFNNYLATKDKLPTIKAEIDRLFQSIDQKNKPASHRYTLEIG